MGRSDGNGTASSKKITPDKIKKIETIGNGSSGTVINEQSPLLSTSVDSAVPKDTCYLTYMIFYLHGIGNILPWNFFITAKEVRMRSILDSQIMVCGFVVVLSWPQQVLIG